MRRNSLYRSWNVCLIKLHCQTQESTYTIIPATSVIGLSAYGHHELVRRCLGCKAKHLERFEDSKRCCGFWINGRRREKSGAKELRYWGRCPRTPAVIEPDSVNTIAVHNYKVVPHCADAMRTSVTGRMVELNPNSEILQRRRLEMRTSPDLSRSVELRRSNGSTSSPQCDGDTGWRGLRPGMTCTRVRMCCSPRTDRPLHW